MTTVLQRIKDQRLTAAQECESRVVFELATEGSEVMTTKQLKLCLRALSFNVTKGEAQTLVYEFDYADTDAIDLADFQKIFLSKVLERSERERFDQAFGAISSDNGDKVSVREVSSALHATSFLVLTAEDNDGDPPGDTVIDGAELRHQIGLQYYDEEDFESVRELLDNKEDPSVSKAALAAFLRVRVHM
ncbi:hypothetical protein PR003_g20594 [Phytophthora rubi]|uniref:Calmodulin n=1 Tax=Phytophthora rubi TaxID=129364 RepID=A0A6A3JIN0_9STRA|nr:hypothetical protein PR002_g19759 [Phytophthora rubi]KAE8997440.1 hypothetical protein PR001_g19582 [Phytophthora rubi]KAE9309072.1 hypothetical protein PR003_g20594 [Phytophthora rubi]